MIRQHYMTICFRGNTEVTYKENDGEIEVTFEQAVSKGFHELVLKIDGSIASCVGFNESEVDYFQRFLSKNRPVIEEEVEEINAEAIYN